MFSVFLSFRWNLETVGALEPRKSVLEDDFEEEEEKEENDQLDDGLEDGAYEKVRMSFLMNSHFFNILFYFFIKFCF